MNEVFIMRKKDVLGATHPRLNAMVKHNHINNDSDASNASKHSSGRRPIIDFIADNIGLSYGSPKATIYANFATCQDTVDQNSLASRTIGSSSRLRKNVTTQTLNMSFTMLHTSIRMAAL